MHHGKFFRVLERPEWPHPCVVWIEVEYDAEPWSESPGTYMGGDSEPVGGVREWWWTVTAVDFGRGKRSDPIECCEAEARLHLEPDFDCEVLGWATEDFANSEPGPWPDEDI